MARHVLLADTQGGAVVYDLDTEKLSTLNATAAAVASACAKTLDFDATVRQWADATGAPPEQIATDVQSMLLDFADRGWTGSDNYPEIFAQNCPVTPLQDGEAYWVQPAGLHCIRWRSTEASLIELVCSSLEATDAGIGGGAGTADALEPTADFFLIANDKVSDEAVRAEVNSEQIDVDRAASSDGVLLRTDTDWSFPSVAAMMHLAIPLVNDWVTRSETEVVMHAAVAVSPGGRTVVIAAPAGSGKSTLIAALVQRGWTFVTDESATLLHESRLIVPYLKPLDLDSRSREALGIDFEPEFGNLVLPRHLGPAVKVASRPVPPPTAVVLVNYIGGRHSQNLEPSVETIEGDEALAELVRNTLNLRYVGHQGLETIVALVQSTSMYRIAYRSTEEALEQLASLGIAGNSTPASAQRYQNPVEDPDGKPRSISTT